jgi:uncharacterized membrane protein
LKARILSGRVLHGRHPGAVTQEMWALLTCYQVLRTAMTDAVLARPDIDPDRLSFSTALRTARDLLIQARGIMTGAVIDLTGRIVPQSWPSPCPKDEYASA